MMRILITGATSGIGFLTGITLAYRKHNVIMCTHNEVEAIFLKERLSFLEKDIKSRIEIMKLDIKDSEDVSNFSNLDIDVLINHAGIGIGGSLIDIELDDIRENFEVNFFASFNLVKIFLNKYINNPKCKKIIITSSIAGIIPLEFLGSYCSSKSAITMMARCLRKELSLINSNIEVSVIQPGAYKTGFNQVMIDKAYDSIRKDSCFYLEKDRYIDCLRFKFDLMEKRELNSIVYKIVECVESNNNKFIYSAPIFQTLMKKIYSFLFY